MKSNAAPPKTFGAVYAGFYDALYTEKEYQAECDMIVRAFKRWGADREVRSILDLGCGTGNHGVPLARMGYEVAGVDRASSMLDRAREKSDAQPWGSRLSLQPGDIRTIRLGRSFDAVLLMFGVLSYQLEDSDVTQTLETARHHLARGGLLIFDVWYGPAVLAIGPSPRAKEFHSGGETVIREASTVREVGRNVCTVRYRIRKEDPKRGESLTQESHSMRFFFTDEIANFLAKAAFHPLRLSAFPDLDLDPDQTTWNLLVIARAE